VNIPYWIVDFPVWVSLSVYNKFSDEHAASIATSRKTSWLGHVQRIDGHRMHKKNPELRNL
jgi:uncharacterized protein (UPF0212 family)